MRYFMFCPLEMEIDKAFEKAREHLKENVIIHVRPFKVFPYKVKPGTPPRALSDTHLVRVEQDDSLRIVDSNFT